MPTIQEAIVRLINLSALHAKTQAQSEAISVLSEWLKETEGLDRFLLIIDMNDGKPTRVISQQDHPTIKPEDIEVQILLNGTSFDEYAEQSGALKLMRDMRASDRQAKIGSNRDNPAIENDHTGGSSPLPTGNEG